MLSPSKLSLSKLSPIRPIRSLGLLATLSLGLAACKASTSSPPLSLNGTPTVQAPAAPPTVQHSASPTPLTGHITLEGSITVFPIAQAMTEEFMADNPDVQITVGVSGNPSGFQKFCTGETDINNAAAPITTAEMTLCAQHGIEYIELPIAYDGLTIFVNLKNTWVTCLTPEELGKMWEMGAENKITQWSQVRSSFPPTKLVFYGLGVQDETYEYFVKATIGSEAKGDREIRKDATLSEDDNVLVQGVERNTNSIGFFNFASYEQNKDSIKAVSIQNSKGECIVPSAAHIADGSYTPLSRPLFMYVNKKSYEQNPQVRSFMAYQIAPENAKVIVQTGYIPLSDALRAKVQHRLAAQTLGSAFGGLSPTGLTLERKL